MLQEINNQLAANFKTIQLSKKLFCIRGGEDHNNRMEEFLRNDEDFDLILSTAKALRELDIQCPEASVIMYIRDLTKYTGLDANNKMFTLFNGFNENSEDLFERVLGKVRVILEKSCAWMEIDFKLYSGITLDEFEVNFKTCNERKDNEFQEVVFVVGREEKEDEIHVKAELNQNYYSEVITDIYPLQDKAYIFKNHDKPSRAFLYNEVEKMLADVEENNIEITEEHKYYKLKDVINTLQAIKDKNERSNLIAKITSLNTTFEPELLELAEARKKEIKKDPKFSLLALLITMMDDDKLKSED